MYPVPIKQLIDAFSKLPSVGHRTAERFVFYLLHSGKREVAELMKVLKNLSENIRSCEICWDFSDKSPCDICRSQKRTQKIICVVEKPQDLQVIERTKEYNGLYHVLRGTIKPEDGPDQIQELKVVELKERIKNEALEEVILAFNPDIYGEMTNIYLTNEIKALNPKIRVTKPARGIPMGGDMQYADDITLSSAFKNRVENK